MTQSNANLYASFQNSFSQHADKVALTTTTDITYSYSNLDQESARLAGFLSQLGLQSGDRISVQVQKSPQALCLYLACLRAGFVFHPLNTGYRENELEYFLSDAEPGAIICDGSAEEVMQRLADKLGIDNLLILNADGSGSLIENSRDTSDEFKIVSREPDDMAALLYSSGTTGVPKGIILTHENLLDNARALVQSWGFTSEDVLFHALPIFHVHGLFVALGCIFLSGGSMRWASTFDAKQTTKYLPECTTMMGVPTYYTRLLALPEFTKQVTANIRVFISGSAPLLAETFVQFEERTGHRILERYGMTETNMNTSNPLVGERKPGTVGLPLPGVEVRIVDDNGEILKTGEIGNLQVRGNNVFKAYWKMPEKTLEDFTADYFFNTGDKGQIDSEGYIAIVGRAKDMVISGGLNVYPKEVELVIDDIAGVLESAVIGVPHPDFGEAVVAVVIASDDNCPQENALVEILKQKLASFKLPKRVMILDELPRNTMGKVQKNVLRDQFTDLFELK
jgi:malonyl-CoA/methylmalonyl-CoA synthetase